MQSCDRITIGWSRSFHHSANRVISGKEHPFPQGPRSEEAFRIIQTLRDAGFVAYLAGGCVRDALLGKVPKDFDVATDATPEAIRKVFGKSKTLAFGASFGVIGVLPDSGSRVAGEGKIDPTEVATFRSDGYYSDGRRPDSVHYGDAKHDAQRRDFTINGLFYDPATDSVIDYVGGREDLEAGVLRTIGDPLQRFSEDKLRMLRAVRFATTLSFAIEETTAKAIVEHADDIAVVSGERIGAEMRRILVSPHAHQGLHHLHQWRLDRVVLPEIASTDLDRFDALITTTGQRTFETALAMLATVTPQPLQTLRNVTRRWRLSNEESRRARAALLHWTSIADADSLPWSTVQPILINRDISHIVNLAAAMIAVDKRDDAGIKLVREALSWAPERLDPPPLLNGDDLQRLGIERGPHYRTLLQSIRDAQLNGEIATQAEAIDMAKP